MLKFRYSKLFFLSIKKPTMSGTILEAISLSRRIDFFYCPERRNYCTE